MRYEECEDRAHEMEVQQQPSEMSGYQEFAWQPLGKTKQLSQNTSTHDYQIVPLTEKDGDRMVSFLRQFFFRDEPLNVEVGLLQSEDDRCVELEEYAKSCIGEGLSLGAVSGSGDLIGVCLNGVGEPGHLNEMEADAASCAHPRFGRILRLLAHIERHADVYRRYAEVDSVAEIRIVSVSDRWRGRGVATALIQHTRNLARQRGHRLLRVDCTSHFTSRAASRLGMTCVYTLPYSEYRDNKDNTGLTPAPPHSAAATYVQWLHPCERADPLAREGSYLLPVPRGAQSRQ